MNSPRSNATNLKSARRDEADPTAAEGSTAVQAALKRALALCIQKTRANIRRMADDPKSAAWAGEGNYFNLPEGFYDIGNWTSFFYGHGLAGLAGDGG